MQYLATKIFCPQALFISHRTSLLQNQFWDGSSPIYQPLNYNLALFSLLHLSMPRITQKMGYFQPLSKELTHWKIRQIFGYRRREKGVENISTVPGREPERWDITNQTGLFHAFALHAQRKNQNRILSWINQICLLSTQWGNWSDIDPLRACCWLQCQVNGSHWVSSTESSIWNHWIEVLSLGVHEHTCVHTRMYRTKRGTD